MNYNRVILGARLTRDPALKYLPSQTALVEFGIACNRRWKTQAGEEKEDVTFVDCVAFGRTGEVINEHLRKGSPILLEGRLTYQSWDDKNGGGKRSKLIVTVESFQFVGNRDGGGEPASDAEPPARTLRERGEQVRRRAAAPSQAPFGEEQHFDEDEIPF